jgi:hypothetical protein
MNKKDKQNKKKYFVLFSLYIALSITFLGGQCSFTKEEIPPSSV